MVSNYSKMSRYYLANWETGVADLFHFFKVTNLPTIYQITGLTAVDAKIIWSATDQEILLVWWDKSHISAWHCDVSPLVGYNIRYMINWAS